MQTKNRESRVINLAKIAATLFSFIVFTFVFAFAR